jgi:zinc D-Ala-D-Ala carboxypeptidase
MIKNNNKSLHFWGLIKNFKENEFLCSCGCKLNNINYDLVSKLEKARFISGIPFVITSACRCQKHNKAVGGVATSSHLFGLAVDILVESSDIRQKVLNSLIKVGFVRIGISKNFIHVDIDSSKNNSVWIY